MKFILIAILVILSLAAAATPVSDDVKAKLTTLDSPLLDVVWCGNTGDNDTNVLILTSNGTVYKSVDRGENWEKLSDIFQNQAIKATQDLQTKHGYINRIVKSPVDPNLVMFLGSEGINYISEDCGNKIRSQGKGKNFREFQYHPVNREWILATSWKNCRNISPGEKCNISRELYLTQNLGKHWEKLTDYVVQFSWGVQKLTNNKNTPLERIVWSQETGTTQNQKTSGWNMKTHLYYSDDFLKTKTMVVSSGNKFLLTENHIFVAQVLDVETQRVNLMISEADTVDYNFQFADISEQLKQHSFTILDSQDETVFININHNRPSSPLGAIYKSDSSGTKFIKTLEYNIRDTSDGQCDFEKVAGLEGIYIANVYSQRVADEYMNMSSAEDSDNIQFETNKFGRTKVTSNLKNFAQKLQDVRQTRITFDQGGMWRPLSPPSRDSRGQSISCDTSQDCSLHLHSVSSKMQFGPFYTSDNALGIIMGTGNVGKNLLNRSDQINTYLSRDGGSTWYEVKKGSHIYEFADHGGIILMADDQNSTKYLYYSWDEGFTWEKLNFYDRPVEVTNIITEPSNVGTRFLVYGTTTVETNNQQKQQGIVISVDFADLHNSCVGHDSPNTDDSDYELWSPNGKVSPDCLLGRKTTYVRRKRTAKCFNGYDFDRILNVDHCECTEDDWECDVMFERDQQTGECVFIGNREYGPSYDSPDTCENYYYVTQGYRKISGDSCVGGVNHAAIKLPCPYFSFLGGNTWQNFFFLISFFTGVYFIYQNKELVMENLEKLVTYLSSMIQIKSAGSSSQSNAGQYMNFQDMDLEQNNPSFDDNLVQEKWEGEENSEDNLAQQSQENKTENVQEKQKEQKVQEETNLLDGDDQEDEGFDPRN